MLVLEIILILVRTFVWNCCVGGVGSFFEVL